MDTEPTIKNILVVILPAILTVFIIFFLVMPKVRENRELEQQRVGTETNTTVTPASDI